MRVWKAEFTRDAEKDFEKLDNSARKQVLKVIQRILQNPLPKSEGGYGTPLHGNLAGYCRIKLKKLGIRIIYKLIRVDDVMKIIVIAARADNIAYQLAEKRSIPL